MKTNEEKIIDCKNRISDLENMLEMMPKDTMLGRLCILSYIKKAKKTLIKLEKERDYD